MVAIAVPGCNISGVGAVVGIRPAREDQHHGPDDNDNIVSVDVVPVGLPGGGSLSVNGLTGVVSVNTAMTTQLGDYPVTVTVTDACGASAAQGFTLTVIGVPPASNVAVWTRY